MPVLQFEGKTMIEICHPTVAHQEFGHEFIESTLRGMKHKG